MTILSSVICWMSVLNIYIYIYIWVHTYIANPLVVVRVWQGRPALTLASRSGQIHVAVLWHVSQLR